jgi:peptide/nickel transport system substrate-binding protein/microcin C transport system substrate-binding protein
MLTFDRKAALALLKEDGWADTDKDNILDKTINGVKTPFKFVLSYNANNAARAKIAQIVKENFKAAGIEVEIRALEWNAYLSDLDKRNFQAFIMAWSATPYPNPRQIWHSESEKNGGSNIIGYSNPAIDQLIDQANLEFDLKKRAETLKKINRILYEDQPYAFLSEMDSLIAGFNKKIKSSVWVMKYDVGPPIDIYQFTE